MEALLTHLQHALRLHLSRHGLLRSDDTRWWNLLVPARWHLHDWEHQGKPHGLAADWDKLLLHLCLRGRRLHLLANDSWSLWNAWPILRSPESHLGLHLLRINQLDLVRFELRLGLDACHVHVPVKPGFGNRWVQGIVLNHHVHPAWHPHDRILEQT